MLLLCSLAAAMLPAGAEPIIVTYPQPETVTDVRSRYSAKLLEQALERAGGAYQMRLSNVRMQQGRALQLLKQGQGIDIVNFMTSNERETELLPIRIPTDKGLIGLRLLLINKGQEAQFSQITRIEQLRTLRAGQGADWPDVEILRSNDFTVHTTTSYDSLFKMLESRRIDYFPRSVVEIWDEAKRVAPRGLVIEPTLILRYPSATYFFVNKNNPKLAAAVQEGLEKMVADGSLDRLFYQFHDDVLKRANLKQRRLFELRNPLLPPRAPSENKGGILQ